MYCSLDPDDESSQKWVPLSAMLDGWLQQAEQQGQAQALLGVLATYKSTRHGPPRVLLQPGQPGQPDAAPGQAAPGQLVCLAQKHAEQLAACISNSVAQLQVLAQGSDIQQLRLGVPEASGPVAAGCVASCALPCHTAAAMSWAGSGLAGRMWCKADLHTGLCKALCEEQLRTAQPGW
jgi:hypothetical protein